MGDPVNVQPGGARLVDWLEATPADWFVVFKRRSRFWWLNRLPIGKYKHVLAFGYVESAGVWLMVNVGWNRCQIAVFPDDKVEVLMTEQLFQCDIVKVPAGGAPRKLPYFGFWCVPAMAYIVGVKSSALRPDTFLRDCLRAGGEFIDGRSTQPEGSGHQRRTAAAGGAGEG